MKKKWDDIMIGRRGGMEKKGRKKDEILIEEI